MPDINRSFCHRHHSEDAGIVDEQIDPTTLGADAIDHFRPRGLRRDVVGEERDAPVGGRFRSFSRSTSVMYSVSRVVTPQVQTRARSPSGSRGDECQPPSCRFLSSMPVLRIQFVIRLQELVHRAILRAEESLVARERSASGRAVMRFPAPIRAPRSEGIVRPRRASNRDLGGGFAGMKVSAPRQER